MLWTRLRSYSNFVRNSELHVRGNDQWYHFHETTYVVQNWPSRMPSDIWTGVPAGIQAGQFGTLRDHITAVGI